MTKFYAEITGWGKCLPPAVLSNDDFSTFIVRLTSGFELELVSKTVVSVM